MTSEATIHKAALRVELPWPYRQLSPNARPHWSRKAKAAAAYREACGWSAIQARGRSFEGERVLARITFHPPDARARDIDNMLSSIKSGIDGVANIIGVDDSKWAVSLSRGEPDRPFGRVVIELEAA